MNGEIFCKCYLKKLNNLNINISESIENNENDENTLIILCSKK